MENAPIGFASEARLHLWPSGGFCTFHSAQGASLGVEVNPTGAEILCEVDGVRTRRQICDTIAARYHTGPDVGAQVAAFLQGAVRTGLLTDRPGAERRRARVTGSRTYFAPLHVMFEITRNCNLRCLHCYNQSGLKKHSEMPTEDLLALMHRFSSDGAESAELTGGEPLTHPDFFEILNTAGRLFRPLGILSNGWFIDDAAAERISAAGSDLLVQVDMDGCAPATHDRLRGVSGAFNRACRAVVALAKAGVRAKVAMTVTPESVCQVRETIALAHDLGASLFGCAFVTPFGRGRQMEVRLDEAGMREFSSALLWAEETYPGFYYKPEVPDWVARRRNCGAGYRSIVLTPTGEVLPCALMTDLGISLGNVRRQGFEAVLGSKEAAFLHSLEMPRGDGCSACPRRGACGCTLDALVHARDLGSACQWAERTSAVEVLKPTYPGRVSLEASAVQACGPIPQPAMSDMPRPLR